MLIKTIDRNEMEYIFKTFMPEAFPPKELKSLAHMHLLFDSGNYHCMGAYEGETLLAYAMFAISPQKDCALLDYLATTKQARNKGVGSEFVKAIKADKDFNIPILLEVDNPNYAQSDAEKNIRERRIQFYLRNGCEMTGLETYVYEVNFNIMALNHSTKLDDVRISTDKLYRTIFSKQVLKDHVEILN